MAEDPRLFDSAYGERELVYFSRVSLRDLFAAAALAGMISSESNGIDRTKVNKRKWAGVAYDFADAMLAAREGES